MSGDAADGETADERANDGADGDATAPTGALDALRADPTRRRLVMGSGIVVGLIVGLFHWLGFVLGGALVAVPQPSLRRGLAAGVGFGLFAWLVFVAWLASVGALDTYVQMGPVLGVSTATPIVGGLLGSLLRGVW